jgi:hypothetical protein
LVLVVGHQNSELRTSLDLLLNTGSQQHNTVMHLAED